MIIDPLILIAPALAYFSVQMIRCALHEHAGPYVTWACFIFGFLAAVLLLSLAAFSNIL